MATGKDLARERIEALAGTREAVTGLEYPPEGLQPYYAWLVRSLHRLAEASAGALVVRPSAEAATAVDVAPGRARIDGQAVAYDGGTVELGTYNNATVRLWLHADEGEAAVGVGEVAGGWPGEAHVKLAEVTLEAGAIASLADRRFETIFDV